MKRHVIGLAVLLAACLPCRAQQDSGPASAGSDDAIRQRIASYVGAFNAHDAAAVGSFWTADGVSVNQETGERITGRDALVQDFAGFFAANAGAQLAGQVDNLRLVRPGVALAEGQATLFLPDLEPVVSAFTAVLVQEGEQWLISSSHERSLPTPATPYDALQELEWLVGTWQDQTEGAEVTTTVRWSPNQAFLIRSFSAGFDEGDSLQGTQVIGWDPLNKQIRTWTFNSDGSFGQGTVSKHDDGWMLKMWQILNDGRLASGTSVITVVDENTMTVQKIGQTVDGEPVPTADPVAVIRVDAAAATPADAEGATP